MKVMIVEDEPGIRKLLEKIISKNQGFGVAAQCGSFREAVEKYSVCKPDIVFMDIEIKEDESDETVSGRVNGVECARLLTNLNSKLKIIFVTAHSEYMSNAFDIYAYDYIVKPFDSARIERTLRRIAENDNTDAYSFDSKSAVHDTQDFSGNGQTGKRRAVSGIADKLMIRGRESTSFIDVDEIVMVERQGGNTKIHTLQGLYTTSMGLGELEEKLDRPQFMRSHKSFIINMDYVSRIEPYGRWTYIVKFSGKDYDALITTAKYDEIKKIYG